MVNLKQTWWHIEEIYFPTNARKIRQVVDLFTNQTQVTVILKDDEFVGLRIIARNSSNREISFLEGDEDSTNTLILNLDPLDSFPAVPEDLSDDNPENKDFRHVKIEIGYILINPKIENLKYNKLKEKMWNGIWDKILHKKTSTIELSEKVHPELYITLPLGWRMGGSKFFTKLLKPKKDREGYSVGMKCYIENAESSDAITLTPINVELDMEFYKPFIKLNNGKRTYNYLTHADSFSKFREVINKNSKIRFEFTYRSQVSFMMAIISLIPFLVFLPFSVLIFICLYLTNVNSVSILNSNFAIGYFILLASFSIFYYSLIKEGYDIPYKYWYMPVFSLSIFVIAMIILIEIYFEYILNI